MPRSLKIVSIATLLLFVACTKPKPVAEVGSYVLTNKDVAQREEVIKTLNPQVQKPMGLEQLIRSYTMVEVLKAHGRVITDADFEAEEKRLAMYKGPNNKIDDIKSIFGKDNSAMRRIYVLPLLAERLAYQELFSKDDKAVGPAKKAAESLLAEIQRSPERMADVAKAKGYSTKHAVLNAEEGLIWDEERTPTAFAVPRGKPLSSMWERDFIKGLPPGKVLTRLIEFGNHWLVLKNLGAKTKGQTEIMVAGVPRPTFGGWFEEAKKSVVVKRL